MAGPAHRVLGGLLAGMVAIAVGMSTAQPADPAADRRSLPDSLSGSLPDSRIFEPEPVGSVTRVRGVVEADDINGAVRALQTGFPIFHGDRLITGPDTRLQITLTDGTTITLGETSRISIDGYVFDEAGSSGGALFRLTKGVFRMVTGTIADLAGQPLRVRTPVATIGMHGTDFWLLQSAQQLQLVLLSGSGVYVENAAGRTDIDEPGHVTVVAGPDQPPTPAVPLPADILSEATETVDF